MLQNGKMMVVKNGKTTSLDRDMTLSNGTHITKDGACTKKDGTKMTMKEGEHMDMSGNMLSMKTNNKSGNQNVQKNTTEEKTNKEKNMYLVPDTTRNREK